MAGTNLTDDVQSGGAIVEGGNENDTQHSGGAVQRLTAKSTSIASLAALLSRYMGQPVVDQTGINGAYDFELRWRRDEQSTDPGMQDRPPIFTAPKETLGLRLRRKECERTS